LEVNKRSRSMGAHGARHLHPGLLMCHTDGAVTLLPVRSRTVIPRTVARGPECAHPLGDIVDDLSGAGRRVAKVANTTYASGARNTIACVTVNIYLL
jgi:hypothetical protein